MQENELSTSTDRNVKMPAKLNLPFVFFFSRYKFESFLECNTTVCNDSSRNEVIIFLILSLEAFINKRLKNVLRDDVVTSKG